MRIRGAPATLLGLVLACSAVLAQSNITLRVLAQQEVRVTTEDGSTEYRLVPATTVLPGDEVVYTLFFKNEGDLPATDIVIDDPIPKEVALQGGSVFGAGTEISYSVDGGHTFGRPEQLGMIENGVTRPARPDEYTHIRWVFRETLNSGDERFVGFRAVLR